MSSSPKADKRLLIASIVVFLVTCVGAVLVLQSRVEIPGLTPPATATLQSNDQADAIIADLTQLPNATPLAGEMAEKVTTIESLVEGCPDYTNERRAQVAQHIAWLREPATLPQEMIIALGGNATEGLLRGLATYTLSDWGLKDRAEDSCLLPIGQQLNLLLVDAEGEAIPAFEGVAE